MLQYIYIWNELAHNSSAQTAYAESGPSKLFTRSCALLFAGHQKVVGGKEPVWQAFFFFA